jgi:hypothetical protein
MTIWLLVVLVLASVVALGYRQGAIRVAFSFVGILMGVLLAAPLAKLLKPLLGLFGVKSPILLWVLPPVIGFILVSILFKILAAVAHQKIEVYYKYKAGDLRLALWERLNHRMGACLGLLNGIGYVVLIAFGIYAFSYWTVQLATTENEPTTIRLLNRMGKDLQTTGFSKVARSVDSLHPAFYEVADLTGLIFNNPLLEARLSRYPAFLGLAERQELQDIANDTEFTNLRVRGESFQNLLEHPRMQAIIGNPDLLHTIQGAVVTNMTDLKAFLDTGRSSKYESEKILGRWRFDVNSAAAAMRRARPTVSANEMQRIKRWMVSAFEKTLLIATTEKQAYLKNLPGLKVPAPNTVPGPVTVQNLQGTWDETSGKYLFAFSGNDLIATLEGGRLSMSSEGMNLVFVHED